MTVFITVSLLTGIAFLVHLILWRARRPRHDYRVLLLLFATVLAVWLVWAVVHSTPLWQLLHTAVCYSAVGLAYVVAYSSVEGDSPTLSLVRFIAEKGTAGRTREEVTDFFARRPFAASRLAALTDAGMIREQDGRYFVAGKGSFAFRFVLAYRRVYGNLPRGG